jgi:hypothetical protein
LRAGDGNAAIHELGGRHIVREVPAAVGESGQYCQAVNSIVVKVSDRQADRVVLGSWQDSSSRCGS